MHVDFVYGLFIPLTGFVTVECSRLCGAGDEQLDLWPTEVRLILQCSKANPGRNYLAGKASVKQFPPPPGAAHSHSL